MLKALPVFLNCFYRLVSSIMYEGRQKGETDKGRHASYICIIIFKQLKIIRVFNVFHNVLYADFVDLFNVYS